MAFPRVGAVQPSGSGRLDELKLKMKQRGGGMRAVDGGGLVKGPAMPKRFQNRVANGTGTSEGQANRYEMFKRGELPGQQLNRPQPMPMEPTYGIPDGDNMAKGPDLPFGGDKMAYIGGSPNRVDYRPMPMPPGGGPGGMTPAIPPGIQGGKPPMQSAPMPGMPPGGAPPGMQSAPGSGIQGFPQGMPPEVVAMLQARAKGGLPPGPFPGQGMPGQQMQSRQPPPVSPDAYWNVGR